MILQHGSLGVREAVQVGPGFQDHFPGQAPGLSMRIIRTVTTARTSDAPIRVFHLVSPEAGHEPPLSKGASLAFLNRLIAHHAPEQPALVRLVVEFPPASDTRTCA